MKKQVNENDKRTIQNIVEFSNHEGISEGYDELGPKECPLAEEMQDYEQKVEAKKKKADGNKSEFHEDKSTGIDSMTGKDKNSDHKKIDLKENRKDKVINNQPVENKINLAHEDKFLCSFDNQNQKKDLNSISFQNQSEKSSKENVIFIPEEESKYNSESNLIGKKMIRESEHIEQRRNSEEDEINNNFGNFGLDIDDYFNNINNREEGDDERFDNSIFDLAEINCNQMRYNSGFSPHIENESEFLPIVNAPSGTYPLTSYINSTSPESNPETMINNYNIIN